MAAYERQRRLPSSHLPSTVVQVGGSRIGHIKPRGGEGDGLRSAVWRIFAAYSSDWRPPTHSPSLRPSPCSVNSSAKSRSENLLLPEFAETCETYFASFMLTSSSSTNSSFYFFPCTFSLLLFFSVFHILLFGLNYTYTERNLSNTFLLYFALLSFSSSTVFLCTLCWDTFVSMKYICEILLYPGDTLVSSKYFLFMYTISLW